MPDAESSATDQSQQETTEQSENQESGDRPEWMPERFWNSQDAQSATTATEKLSAASMAALKSYGELEAKLKQKTDTLRDEIRGERKANVPEAYEFGDVLEYLPQGIEIDNIKNDPMFGWFEKVAREAEFSGQEFQGAMKSFFELLGDQQKQQESRIAEALGESAAERISTVSDWIKNNIKDELAEAALPFLAEEPAVIQALEALRTATMPGSHANRGDGSDPEPKVLSRAEIRSLEESPAFWDPTHPQYKEVHRKVDEGYANLDKLGRLG